MRAFKGCFSLSQSRKYGREDPIKLASETSFSVNEVEALYDLFKKLSSSIIKDNLIHKEEFRLALFRNSSKHNIFADKVFDLFDVKHNGVIEFGEFVRSLSIFHPNASEAEKTMFAFRLYDLRDTGYIEREELATLISYGPPAAMVPSVIARSVNSAINGLKLKEMVLAVLSESDTILSSDDVETIVDKTMAQADLNGDGKIDREEWREFVAKNPSILKNMTLPHLKEVTLAFPSFVLNTEVE